jgi:GTPase SAR1 family protein
MDFKYINEQPLKSSNDLDFGHKEIVTTIDKIVVNQSWNITIGLFGNWGTGKSTIVESLKDSLKAKKVPMVIFDVWKHDGDSLRRTFLKEFVTQLNSDFYGSEYLQSTIFLDDRLTSATNRSEDFFSIKWRKILMILAIVIFFGIGFLVAGAILYALLLILDVDILANVRWSGVIKFIAGGISASIVFKFFDSFIKTEKVDIREDKYQDPHEFEHEFKRLVECLLNTPKKVVITFDNLDRVSGDSALSIISTIKTFLDIKSSTQHAASVIFLIPCDIDSMKRHIRHSLKSKDGMEENLYIDEFLRKFFNTSIWIPDFHGTDLEKFATSKLAETCIPEFGNAYLSWLIIKVFNRNPRQIIQFVNHLVSNYLIYEQICLQNGLSDLEFHKKYVPQLAKFLLIKQRHPDCLELYRSSQIFQLESEEILNQIEEKSFKDLLQQTADIYIPSLEPYFKGKVTSEEQQFPGIVKLLELMKYDVDEHLDYAKSLQLAENSIAFDSILKTEFNRLYNPIGKTVFLNHLLDLTSHYHLTLSQGFYRDIINFLLSDAHSEIFYKVDALHLKPEIFVKASSAVTERDKQKVLAHYLNIICDNKKDIEKISPENSQRYYGQVFKFFTLCTNLFSSDQITRLRGYFMDHPAEFDLRHHFFKDEKTQEFFIDNNLIEYFLKSFSMSDSNQVLCQKLDLIHNFHPPLKYTAPILSIFGEFWNKIFIAVESDDVETIENLLRFNEILRERIEMATVSSIVIDNNLIDNIYRYIIGLQDSQVVDWILIIHRLLGHKNAISTIAKIMSRILSSENDENIEGLLRLFPNRQDIITLDTQLADDYLNYLSQQPVEDYEYRGLSDSDVCKIIKKLLIRNEIVKVEYVITNFRDKLGSESKTAIFEILNESIGEAIKNEEPIENIELLFNIILLLSDLDPETIDASGFWTILPELLKDNSSEVESMLGKRLILDNQQLLSSNMAENLFNIMISTMDSQGIYNNAQFHETLNIIRFKLGAEVQKIYFDRILRSIVRYTQSQNVILLAAEALEKSKFDVDGQLSNILDFENYVTSSMTIPEKERVYPVLTSILKLLKNKRGTEFKALTARLRQIIG